ncbi:MarR family winged helix-turn-helix transcriptional regulator [Gordonibacter sp. 28C]|uniref:MarR family winged helix-turn-helix transcriptional regulator n=1 Tax=Gordonibacter sp. 28C TaxID=2078569 RepID=UPI0011C04D0A|nr:MarR family transcriptional regulator [Gordonibacter sp. 28C]
MKDDSIMRELAHLNQVLEREARADGGATGVSLALAILASHEEAIAEGFASRLLTQAELADIVGVRPQSMGAMIAAMEQEGLVLRDPFEQDRRVHLLRLTDKGRAAAQEARDRQRAFAEKKLSVLSDEEKRQFADIVTKLNASLG